MITFFDVETTGKADMRSGPENPNQPRVVQFAALLMEDDGTERGAVSMIIKPDGWTIPEDAAEVHGITTEIAQDSGISVIIALGAFSAFCGNSSVLIAHNIDFDLLVVKSEYWRAGKPSRTGALEKFCTMRSTTKMCKLPGNYGDYKWPKLIEAHQFLFGTGFEGAHDALADVRACARIYFEVLKRTIKKEIEAKP